MLGRKKFSYTLRDYFRGLVIKLTTIRHINQGKTNLITYAWDPIRVCDPRANREAEALTCHSEIRNRIGIWGFKGRWAIHRTVRTDVWYLDVCYATQRSYPTSKVRKGGGEDIPLVQGKEQWLHFAGAAVKRYPTPKVRETQVRR